MNPEFWKSRKVALIGGASLIGSHLAEALLPVSKDVVVVDNFSVGKPEYIPYGAGVWQDDMRDSNAVSFVLGKYRPDIVFHLAARHGGRGYVSGHSVELWDNLSLDLTVFRACSEFDVEKVIFSSSACAYPIRLQNDPKERVFLSEEMIDYSEIQQPDGPYGMEKLIGEQSLDAYVERGLFKGCSTRSFTVYGERMGESHAIGALIAKTLLKLDPFPIWGDPDNLQIRNWTYVKDNVNGAILAAENVDRGAINIGVEERMTPLDAVENIWEIMGWRPDKIDWQTDKPTGPKNRTSNSSKLKELGWKPNYSFHDGLKRTIDWYLASHSEEKVRENFERKLTEV